MNLSQLSKQIGTSFRLRPLPTRVLGETEILAPSDDKWRLDAVLDGPSRLRLANIHTGHICELGADNVREFRTPDFLLLRCQIIIRPGSIDFEPFVTRDGESLSLVSVASKVAPIHLDDILDHIGKLPLIQRNAAVESYLGLLVTFTGPIWSMTPCESDRVRVQVSTPRHETDVWFEVRVKDHPQIFLAAQGSTLTVVGVLERMPLGFGLGEVTISDMSK